MLEITISTGTDFDRAIAALGKGEVVLPIKLNRAIAAAAEVMAERARTNARAIPSKGVGHTGLRDRVASGVGIVPVGEDAFRVTTSMPVANQAIIPRGFDSSSGWRHPVFGDRSVWVTQAGGTHWFMNAMEEGAVGAEAGVVTAVDETLAGIKEGTL